MYNARFAHEQAAYERLILQVRQQPNIDRSEMEQVLRRYRH